MIISFKTLSSAEVPFILCYFIHHDSTSAVLYTYCLEYCGRKNASI